jgi:hypothetical protein
VGGGLSCAILILAWVTSWGAQLGDRGGGGGSVMVVFFFLLMSLLFGGEREAGEEGKNKGGPKKKKNAMHRPRALSEGNPRYKMARTCCT